MFSVFWDHLKSTSLDKKRGGDKKFETLTGGGGAANKVMLFLTQIFLCLFFLQLNICSSISQKIPFSEI